MTIDQIIALFASVVGCFAAVATFLNVREMKQAREATYLPKLLIAKTTVFGVKDTISNLPWPSFWTVDENVLRERDDEVRLERLKFFHLNLINIGLGPAKNVTALWSANIEDLVNIVNDLASDSGSEHIVSLENSTIHFNVPDCPSHTSMFGAQREVNIDYIMPAQNEKGSCEIILPPAFVSLTSAIFFFVSKNKSKLNLLNIPPMNLIIEYFDIGGKRHVVIFDIHIMIDMLAGDASFFQARIQSEEGKMPAETFTAIKLKH